MAQGIVTGHGGTKLDAGHRMYSGITEASAETVEVVCVFDAEGRFLEDGVGQPGVMADGFADGEGIRKPGLAVETAVTGRGPVRLSREPEGVDGVSQFGGEIEEAHCAAARRWAGGGSRWDSIVYK